MVSKELKQQLVELRRLYESKHMGTSDRDLELKRVQYLLGDTNILKDVSNEDKILIAISDYGPYKRFIKAVKNNSLTDALKSIEKESIKIKKGIIKEYLQYSPFCSWLNEVSDPTYETIFDDFLKEFEQSNEFKLITKIKAYFSI
jgi:hypothetical protein